MVVFMVGAGLVTLSLLGHNPGFGLLALYIIFCMTLSIMPFLLRAALMFALVMVYVVSLRVAITVRWGSLWVLRSLVSGRSCSSVAVPPPPPLPAMPCRTITVFCYVVLCCVVLCCVAL